VIRGNGVGYASGMGRAAAIIGPVIAGYLLSANLPLRFVLLAIAAPYVAVAAICLALDRLQKKVHAEPAIAAAPEMI
jgi:MFS family permease